MKFEITKNIEFITYCLTHPYVWKTRGDDMKNVDPQLFFPPMDKIVYVRAGDYGLLVGLPVNEETLDVHLALLPNARGHALNICKEAIRWTFENLKVYRLVSTIPVMNKHAIKLAEKVGMEFIGIKEKSFIKNDYAHDQYLFSMNKEKLCLH